MLDQHHPTSPSSETWQDRLAFTVQTMRDISRQTDPEKMIWLYASRMRQATPIDGLISLSRRNMQPPWYRITRSTLWKTPLNPWKQQDQLPRFDHGILGELLYGDQPVIIDDWKLPPDDPAAEYLEGHRSLMAIPLFDNGSGVNMVVLLRKQPGAFDREKLPEQVWMSNLFGLMTQNLVLSSDIREAYDTVDRELKAVAAIQRSLLPLKLPQIPTLSLAAHYQTSRRAGGDYYDFFELPDGQWGILIADVSGHGTPAAVLMAITHSIAHMVCDPPAPPAKLMAAINERLCGLYTTDGGQFVTAAYAVYDPAARELSYASAGHPPLRIRRRDGSIISLNGARSLPLGIIHDELYHESVAALGPGDTLVLYTDGITEARSPSGELFDLQRLDATIASCDDGPDAMIQQILVNVEEFTAGRAASDDRTLLVAQVRD
jgi:sigma-B regulation protein RsbU (phosphoserine phosphatase)